MTSKHTPVSRELPAEPSRKKKKNAFLHSPSPKQKSPAEITYSNVGHKWILTHVQVRSPTSGKSSWQSHLNKVQRKTEVGHETELNHSQNLAFP